MVVVTYLKATTEFAWFILVSYANPVRIGGLRAAKLTRTSRIQARSAIHQTRQNGVHVNTRQVDSWTS
jgi:hypothetical protein